MNTLHAGCRGVLATMALLLAAGCGSVSHADRGVHTVNIGPQVDPIQLNAGRGDEVRWMNQRAEPVAVILPTTEAVPLSCLTGFTHVDRTRLSAVIAPHSSASVCFAEMGKYEYLVRLNLNQPGGTIDRVASIWVVAGGKRNPGPAEQFENVTP